MSGDRGTSGHRRPGGERRSPALPEEAPLEARFREMAGEPDGLRAGDRVVVALSGGLDSVVLLHLVRFAGWADAVDVHAAHFDHRMRHGSAEDARWVAGLCRAWRVPLHAGQPDATPRSEEEAREARYGFLERVRARIGARLVLTAHHADDQAETVLFRALRGTGPPGLAGIPGRREPALWRPLLGFWRDDLERYARLARLSWREDPTNAALGYARNALRRKILPEIERLVAPGARRALVRLGRLSGEQEAAWASVLPGLMAPLAPEVHERSASLDRRALSRLHPAVQARVLRALSSEIGVRLDATATRLAVDFAACAASGRRIELAGGWTLERQLERLVLRAAAVGSAGVDRPLRIPGPDSGSGLVLLGGCPLHVRWGEDIAGPAAPIRWVERFDPAALRFPLWVRARTPGDRIRLAGGTKKVKKLFLERRIPRPRRGRIPLVVDAYGEVLWIPAVARALPQSGHSTHGGLGIGLE